MAICRVGVGEMAPELSPGTEGWERLIHDLAQIQPDLLVLNELPVGMQIVGPYLEDRTPIDFARHLADVVGGFEAPTDYVG